MQLRPAALRKANQMIRTLLLLVGVWAPLSAQEVTVADQQSDSVAIEAVRRGQEAADAEDTSGYFWGGLVGGLPIGIGGVGGIGGDAGATERVTVALFGVGGIAMLSSIAGYRSNLLPPELAQGISTRHPRYQEAFRVAFRERLTERRRRVLLKGGILGVAVGVGIVLLLGPAT